MIFTHTIINLSPTQVNLAKIEFKKVFKDMDVMYKFHLTNNELELNVYLPDDSMPSTIFNVGLICGVAECLVKLT